MTNLLDVKIQSQNPADFNIRQGNRIAAYKTEPVLEDKIELSTNSGQNKSSFIETAGILFAGAALLGGCTAIGMKINEKYFQKLACGIKKGEIKEELYNFLKRIDPKGKIFNKKEDVMQLNKDLTDENFLILKQITKMKEKSIFGNINTTRFTSKDITKLIKSINKSNIDCLPQLTEKQITAAKGYSTEPLSTDKIIEIMRYINAENKNAASKMIDKANPDEIEVLINSIKKVNKDNADIYDLVLSTRQRAGKTDLTFEEIHKAAELIKSTGKSRSAEFFLNLKDSKKLDAYRYTVQDLEQYILKSGCIKDENVGIYKKLYEIERVNRDNFSSLEPIFEAVNQNNVDIAEKLLKKEEIFKYYGDIEKILIKTDAFIEKNPNKKSVISGIIDLCNSPDVNYRRNYRYGLGGSDLTDVIETVTLKPEKLQQAENLLKSTTTFDELYNQLIL